MKTKRPPLVGDWYSRRAEGSDGAKTQQCRSGSLSTGLMKKLKIGLKYIQLDFLRENVREIGINVVFLQCRMAQRND